MKARYFVQQWSQQQFEWSPRNLANCPNGLYFTLQKSQLPQRDRSMRYISWNLVNTLHKLYTNAF